MRVRTSWGLLVGLTALAAVGVLRSGAAAPPGNNPDSTADSKRVVAYIFNTTAITREDLGEYLIARMGAERVTNLVNLRIIEHVCRQKGVDVTAAEIEAALEEDLKGLNVNRKEFVDRVLKHYKKTLYEWKHDVIRPRLLMTKMIRPTVTCTEDDLKMAFEAYYGEKVDCRLILWPESEQKTAFQAYEKIRGSDEEFDRAARQQSSPTLAASGGQITPIGRHTTGNPELEKAAYSLQPGELSQILRTPEGFVVLKCVKRIPANATIKLTDVRAKLEKEVIEKKIQVEIPKVFKDLHEQAQAKVFLKDYANHDELLRDVKQELKDLAPGKAGAAPKGN
jgi:hypothetical protein